MSGIDSLAISDDQKPNVPANRIEAANPEFEGLGAQGWASRVVLDGNQLLYKDEDKACDQIIVKLKGGRNVHQVFLEDSQTYIKSYDGKLTTDGEPLSKYPGARRMFELNWTEDRNGEEKEFQMVLSPTSRYAFVEYSQALLDKVVDKAGTVTPLKLTEVDTIIYAVRDQNKDGQRFSKAQFTCEALKAVGWAPAAKKK